MIGKRGKPYKSKTGYTGVLDRCKHCNKLIAVWPNDFVKHEKVNTCTSCSKEYRGQVPNSKYWRAFCRGCGDPIRVDSNDHWCSDCSENTRALMIQAFGNRSSAQRHKMV